MGKTIPYLVPSNTQVEAIGSPEVKLWQSSDHLVSEREIDLLIMQP